MRKVRRSALVPYTARQMFELVDDVESYPEFLPWCNDASVESRDAATVVATLELNKGPISKHFTTRNTRHEFTGIDIALLGGPFRQLAGSWQFRDIAGQGCEVSLELDFKFESRMVDVIFGAFFEDTCNSLVEAFTRRAHDIYGTSR